MLTTKKVHGLRVLGGRKGTRKIGKIAKTVFHPTEPRVVGFIVQRPDALAMDGGLVCASAGHAAQVSSKAQASGCRRRALRSAGKPAVCFR